MVTLELPQARRLAASVVLGQVVITVLAAAICFAVWGRTSGLSALVGGGISAIASAAPTAPAATMYGKTRMGRARKAPSSRAVDDNLWECSVTAASVSYELRRPPFERTASTTNAGRREVDNSVLSAERANQAPRDRGTASAKTEREQAQEPSR